MIEEYEAKFGVNLIVVIDQMFHSTVTLVEEVLRNCTAEGRMHVLLSSPGGDGEVALRVLRAFRSRCSELTIIVPDMAKSAATIVCLGADAILMGPTSDLGPVDPQFLINDQLVGAKQIERAVKSAEERIAAVPESYTLYSNLLGEVNMLMVEEARSAIHRSSGLVKEALSESGRTTAEVARMVKSLKGPLIDDADAHGESIGPEAAERLGLPVKRLDPTSEQWRSIWSLWTRYFELGAWPAGSVSVYESARASQVHHPRKGRRGTD